MKHRFEIMPPQVLTEARRAIASGAATATEITNFFLSHRGRLFEGWTADKVFNYVLVNLVHRNVFTARDEFGLIGLAAIAWLADAATIIAKAERGLPQFDWKGFPTDGDSILIADVAGDRKLMPEILTLINDAWPDASQKRLFTYRRGKLVELSWETVLRFGRCCQQSRDRKGAGLLRCASPERPLAHARGSAQSATQ